MISCLRMPNPRSDISGRGSGAVNCLERAWSKLRSLHPCVPEAVIVVLGANAREGLRGHFAKCVWRASVSGQGHEVAIAPHLFADPPELLHTLLHEAAHGILYEWGLSGGCGPDGYYHREEFRHVCQKLGLECSFNNRRYGWNLTSWPNNTVAERYRPFVVLLRRDLPWGRPSKNLT